MVGTGGATLDNFRGKARYSQRRYNDNYGVLQLQLYPGHYAWQFVSVNGHVRDRGRDVCHLPPGTGDGRRAAGDDAETLGKLISK